MAFTCCSREVNAGGSRTVLQHQQICTDCTIVAAYIMPRAQSRSQTVWNAYFPHAGGAGLPQRCGTWRRVNVDEKRYVPLFFSVSGAVLRLTNQSWEVEEGDMHFFPFRQVSCWSLWFHAIKVGKFICCVYSTVYVLSSREPDEHCSCMPVLPEYEPTSAKSALLH